MKFRKFAQRTPKQYRNRLSLESLEGRRLLAADFYVDNSADYVVTTDQGAAGLDAGDEVTWDSGATHPAGPVTGLIFGTEAFASIDDAVTAAGTGDTVNVAAGTYSENVTINEGITITGAGTGSTIVDQPGNIFVVKSSDVTFQDMTIQNGSQGIRVDLFPGGTADNLEVNNVELLNNSNSSRGIEIHNGTTVTNLEVTNSVFDGNGVGIRWASSAFGDGVLIDNSTFRNHSLGIYQANDGSSGYVQDLTVTNSHFETNSFAAVYGEELSDVEIADNTFEDNGRGFYLFKAYSNVVVPTGNISVHDNQFSDSVAASVEIWSGPFSSSHPEAQISLPIDIEDNVVSEDVGVLAVNWAQIDIRLKDADSSGTQLSHAPVTVSGNTVNLTGSLTGGATAAHAIKLRGDVDGVTVTGNDLDGGGVGGTGSAGTPPTSGIYVVADDGFWGSMSAGSVATIDGNTINNFVNGITSFDPDDGLVGPNLTIIDNAISDNDSTGVLAHAGNTLLQGNDLSNNGEVGLLIENNAVVDAGQDGSFGNFTGLGVSAGGNNFSSYSNTGRTPYVDAGTAIRNLNDDTAATPVGFDSTPPDVTAQNNLFFSIDPSDIETLIDHEVDDDTKGYVEFSGALPYIVVDGTLYVSGSGERDQIQIKGDQPNSGDLELKYHNDAFNFKVNLIGVDAIVIDTGDDDDDVRIKKDVSVDSLEINVGSGNDKVQIKKGVVADSIVVHGGDGNDDITVDKHVAARAFLFGQLGDDKIEAGGGPSVLVGGDGKDDLKGGEGLNILIGGIDEDKLDGKEGDDILIGGSTAADDDLQDLDDSLAEWEADHPSPTDTLTELGAIVDDGDKDDLRGGKGNDHLEAGFGDKVKQ